MVPNRIARCKSGRQSSSTPDQKDAKVLFASLENKMYFILKKEVAMNSLETICLKCIRNLTMGLW